jgi:hypothetical protein
MQQQDLTIQEIIDLYRVENIQPLLEQELLKSNTNLMLPQPCCPRTLEKTTVGGNSVVKYMNGEPFIHENVEIEELDIKSLRSLFLFISEYANFYATRHTIVKIETMLLKEQLEKYRSSLAIRLRESKVPAAQIKDYQNIDTTSNLINAAYVSKKAEADIMETRYDGYRRLINALSREATNRGNFNEYNNQANSSTKWNSTSKNKGGGFVPLRT